MFVSTTINAIDLKGRVSVPAGFRAALKGAEGIYCWPSFEGPCLEAGGDALMRHYAESLARLPPFDPTREALSAAIFGGASFLAFDQTGRVGLPEDLRAHAGLGDKALFVGLIERFQIWSPAAWAERRPNILARANRDKHLLGAANITGAGSGA